ncbi:MAG: hypothetical protein U0821_05040 [Chloroflexota bacterium]
MTEAAPDSERQGPRLLLARALTEVFAPAPCMAMLLFGVTLPATPTLGAGVGWALVAAGFVSALPMAYVFRGVLRDRLTDHHVVDRAQRLAPLVVAEVSATVGAAVLAGWGAPRALVVTMVTAAGGLGIATLITLAWKISFHATGVAGAVALLGATYGWKWLPLGLLAVAAVAWARVELRHHTPGQVAAGAALGASIGWVGTWFL